MAAAAVPESAAQSGDDNEVSTPPAGADGSNSDKTRKPCAVNGCNSLVRSRGLCKAHGGGTRCQVEGCMRGAQSADVYLCIAHGGGTRCSAPNCSSAAQSRGRCKKHGGGSRCNFEGCTKSSQGNGFCRNHGGGYKCKHPGGCMKWAQAHGLCARHGGRQAIESRSKERQPASSSDPPTSDAAQHASNTSQAPESVVRRSVVARPASTVGLCQIAGCSGVVEKRGLCRFHSVRSRCNSLTGCRNMVHANGLCLVHYNAQAAGTSINPGVSLRYGNGAIPSHTTVTNQATPPQASPSRTAARQQELRAREYGDAVVWARSAELLSILGNNAPPSIETTARRQQRVAEQYCNEALAASAIRFIHATPSSRSSAPVVSTLMERGMVRPGIQDNRLL